MTQPTIEQMIEWLDYFTPQREHGEDVVVQTRGAEKTIKAIRAALTAQALPDDEGELWSFMRSTLKQGVDIWHDHVNRHREEYEARIDEAARERVEKLRAAIAAVKDGAG